MAAPHDFSWKRLRPGDDAYVDAYIASQLDALHQQLDAANGWRDGKRQYRMDPPIPRDAPEMIYDLDMVHIRREDSVPRHRIMRLILLAGAMVWAGWAYADAMSTTANVLLEMVQS